MALKEDIENEVKNSLVISGQNETEQLYLTPMTSSLAMMEYG